MNHNLEKYLPIGTIVALKGSTKRLMITGFCCLDSNNQTKIFDYSGCLYPEGIIETNKTFLFDHQQIEKVYHIGFIDKESRDFNFRLQQISNQYNQQVVGNEQRN